MERLRYVARAGQAPDRVLVPESMSALTAFCRDDNAMLVALRQLIARQPESAGILCLGATIVHALDPCDAGWEFCDRVTADRTADIAETVAIAESGGTDVIDSIASGPGEVLCPGGTTAWIEHARASGRSVVVVTPIGTRLPARMWRGFLARNGMSPENEGDQMAMELLQISRFDDVVDADGVRPLEAWAADCPDVAELAHR